MQPSRAVSDVHGTRLAFSAFVLAFLAAVVAAWPFLPLLAFRAPWPWATSLGPLYVAAAFLVIACIALWRRHSPFRGSLAGRAFIGAAGAYGFGVGLLGMLSIMDAGDILANPFGSLGALYYGFMLTWFGGAFVLILGATLTMAGAWRLAGEAWRAKQATDRPILMQEQR